MLVMKRLYSLGLHTLSAAAVGVGVVLGVGVSGGGGVALAEEMPSNLICQTVAKRGWKACATSVRLPLAGKKPRDPRVFFHPRYVSDGDPKTAWAPGQRGLNLGNTIELHFGGSRRFRHLSLWNGYSRTPENWVITGRLRSVLIQTSDGLTNKARLVERDGEQVIELSREVDTTWIRIIALSARRGEIYRAFAISELRPSDGRRGPGVPLVRASKIDDWLPEGTDDAEGEDGEGKEAPKGHSSSTSQ